MSVCRQIVTTLLMVVAMSISRQEQSEAKELGEDVWVVEMRVSV